ncbi:MAG TPA: hypothetical protein VMU48_16660 [Terracidiphilus sp.]|nr:hypothetical protein [Terracidiphilus sp.]
MWRPIVLLSLMGILIPIHAETRVTVAQLRQFLGSKSARKATDAQLADRLGSVALSEQLTEATLRKIHVETKLGPKATEQLDLLATTSVFGAPPAAEMPAIAPPDSSSQLRMINAADKFVGVTLHQLPDFLASRETISFDNSPQVSTRRHAKPRIQLHWVRKYDREIAYRNGYELVDSASGGARPGLQPSHAGLTTFGEFGPILSLALGDALKGSITWSRWQANTAGKRLAVFHFEVPKSVSHYLVDMCCFRKSHDDPQELSFRDTPGYGGELYIEPETGVIERITLEAGLPANDLVAFVGISVQYGKVRIGERTYICPIHGVAVSRIHNPYLPSIDGIGIEEFVNEILFQDYHKFESSSRILTANPAAVPK